MGWIGTCHCPVPFLTYVRTNSVPVRVGTSSCVPRDLSLIPYPAFYMREGLSISINKYHNIQRYDM